MSKLTDIEARALQAGRGPAEIIACSDRRYLLGLVKEHAMFAIWILEEHSATRSCACLRCHKALTLLSRLEE